MDCQKSKLVQPAAENSDYGDSITSNRLKEALRATATFGRAAQDTMFHDLELNRITFKDMWCTLSELLDALKGIFRHDGTNIDAKALKGTIRILGKSLVPRFESQAL